MQRRHRVLRQRLEEREMQQVDVEVQDVELAAARAHFVQHREMCGDIGLERRGVEPDRLVAHRCEPRPRPRVAACEQRDVVAERHQRFGEVRDDPFGPAVKARRHRLAQRGDLRDLHRLKARRKWRNLTPSVYESATASDVSRTVQTLSVDSDARGSARPAKGTDPPVIQHGRASDQAAEMREMRHARLRAGHAQYSSITA